MKKLILMTSALTLVGGTAFAAGHSGGDITITAEGGVAFGNWDGAAAGISYTGELGVAAEGTSGGLTYGFDGTIDLIGGANSGGVFYVSGGFGKFSFGDNEFDVITDDVGDIQYEGTFGDITATLTAEVGGTDEWLAEFDYAGAGFNLGLSTDSAGTSEVSADVEVGNFTVGVTADNNSAWDVFVSTDLGGITTKVTHDSAGVTGLELDGTAGDVTWGVSIDSNNATTADLEVALGDATVTLAHDSGNAGGTGDDAENVLMFEYGMDNITFHVNLNDANEYEVGATATFDF